MCVFAEKVNKQLLFIYNNSAIEQQQERQEHD